MDETGMLTLESIFIFTLFGKFERWLLFAFECRTLTIPRLPSGDSRWQRAVFGVGWTLRIPQLPLGDLRGQVALPDLVRLAKNGRRSLCAHRATELKSGNPRKCPNLRA